MLSVSMRGANSFAGRAFEAALTCANELTEMMTSLRCEFRNEAVARDEAMSVHVHGSSAQANNVSRPSVGLVPNVLADELRENCGGASGWHGFAIICEGHSLWVLQVAFFCVSKPQVYFLMPGGPDLLLYVHFWGGQWISGVGKWNFGGASGWHGFAIICEGHSLWVLHGLALGRRDRVAVAARGFGRGGGGGRAGGGKGFGGLLVRGTS